MQHFVINDMIHGALVPLNHILNIIHPEGADSWRLRDISLIGIARPFGMDIDQFMSASRSAPLGISVSHDEFIHFLEAGAQIIDGEIQAWTGQPDPRLILIMDCQDASQWDIITDSPEVIRSLLDSGYRPVS